MSAANKRDFGQTGNSAGGKAVNMQADLERILFEEKTISRRLDELAAQISADYHDRELTVVATSHVETTVAPPSSFDPAPWSALQDDEWLDEWCELLMVVLFSWLTCYGEFRYR